jgi:hypothetical protein
VTTADPDVVVDVTVDVTVSLPVAICEHAYEILDAGHPATTAGATARRSTLSAGLEVSLGGVGTAPVIVSETGGSVISSSSALRFTFLASHPAVLVAVAYTVLTVLVKVKYRVVVVVG